MEDFSGETKAECTKAFRDGTVGDYLCLLFFVVRFVVNFESLSKTVFDHTNRESQRLFQISFNLLTSSHASM